MKVSSKTDQKYSGSPKGFSSRVSGGQVFWARKCVVNSQWCFTVFKQAAEIVTTVLTRL